MNLKTILLASTIFLTPLFTIAQDKYPLDKNGKTTAEGLELFVPDNQEYVNSEFDKKLKVTSNYDYFDVDDLRLRKHPDAKGLYQGGTIYIDTVKSFEDYSLGLVPKWERKLMKYKSDFVLATMFHEKGHCYFNQLKDYYNRLGAHFPEKKIKLHIEINSTEEYKYGESFIEEGVAEYCTWKAGEIIIPEEYIIPKNLEDSIKIDSRDIKYKYSLYYVKDFLDLVGLEFGIQIFLTNPAPSIEEIKNPKLFYRRLKHGGGLDLKFFKPQDFKTK